MIFSSNFLKRVSFQKGPRWDMIFLVLSWIMVFFSRKNDIFSLGTKWEMTFLKKYVERWYFLCIPTGVTNVASRPSVKKNQKWSYSAKIHLKVINVLDWHPRKSSSKSLYFHGDLYRRFHVLLSSEKNQETSYIRLKFDFFNLFDWRYSVMNNLQYFVPFSPQKLCLEGGLSANKGTYLSIRRWVIIAKM